MAKFILKTAETIHAMTIDILDDQNQIQLNVNRNDMLNLTWIWDGIADVEEEKRRLLDEIQDELLYIHGNYGSEISELILSVLYQKIERTYLTLSIH